MRAYPQQLPSHHCFDSSPAAQATQSQPVVNQKIRRSTFSQRAAAPVPKKSSPRPCLERLPSVSLDPWCKHISGVTFWRFIARSTVGALPGRNSVRRGQRCKDVGICRNSHSSIAGNVRSRRQFRSHCWLRCDCHYSSRLHRCAFQRMIPGVWRIGGRKLPTDMFQIQNWNLPAGKKCRVTMAERRAIVRNRGEYPTQAVPRGNACRQKFCRPSTRRHRRNPSGLSPAGGLKFN